MAQLATARAPIALGLNPKLSSALTDPLRGRILAELDDRPLSPSQFTRETGGEVAQVSRCFRHLERCGYAEVVEERPGTRRGRSVEHVYRRTPNRHWDTWPWPDGPRVERTLSSFPDFEPYFARLVAAIEAETIDREIDRHLSWDIRVLDEGARAQVAQRIDRVLDWLANVEADAAGRRLEATREVIPATVGLFTCASPQPPADVLRRPRGLPLAEADKAAFSFPPEMANAMGNRWRAQILFELLSRPMSPSQFVEGAGGDPSYVARCFRDLADWGLIELMETRTGGSRRGGVERVYRNARALHFHMPAWRTMPHFMRVEISSGLAAGYIDRLDEAVGGGERCHQPDLHLAWRPCVFDRSAWREVGIELNRILYWMPQLEREAVERARGDCDRLLPTAIGLACFRSPPG